MLIHKQPTIIIFFNSVHIKQILLLYNLRNVWNFIATPYHIPIATIHSPFVYLSAQSIPSDIMYTVIYIYTNIHHRRITHTQSQRVGKSQKSTTSTTPPHQHHHHRTVWAPHLLAMAAPTRLTPRVHIVFLYSFDV